MLTAPASPKDPGEAIPQQRQGWQALSMTEPHSDQNMSNVSQPQAGASAISAILTPSDTARETSAGTGVGHGVGTSGTSVLDHESKGSEPLGPGDVKQVIVIRRDLHMRRGKEIAQGSHASSAWISFAVADALRRGETTLDLSTITEAAKVWLTTSFRKVTLQVQTEEDIVSLHEQAVAAGLESQLITDSGKTEFGGNPTITALAIGPNRAIDIDAITGHLGIY